ncbi:hypothetical protein [Vogesella indigofera]|uniref:hypothetical protein n=1 Tax=Vogesella indigofera TaxID=45465 RepID=UPI00234EE6B9|nr:hypothetical protein [Vogesella indigofera]MDC7709748.1 hypothetical protein [Vogesella indigofera]
MLALVPIRFGVHEPNVRGGEVRAAAAVVLSQDHRRRRLAAAGGGQSPDADSEFVQNVLWQMPEVASIHASLAQREVKADSRLLVSPPRA